MSAHSRRLLDKWLPQLAVSPALVVSLVFFYGLTIWVGAVSFTDSEGVVTWNWVGWEQYARLFADDSWWRSLWNLARYLPLVVGVPLILGCLLAMLLDQKVRFENGIRTAVLYPLALSWIVAGTIWRWLLTPDTGIEKWLISVGFEGAVFDWIVQPRMSIYALVIVAVWASTGFVMSMFIAGLRSIDDSVIKAAMIDGASKPRIYLRVLLPTLRPTIFSAALILLPAALRTFDLVVVLTQGGPGQSSVLPAFYVFDRFFRRDQMGLGAASAMMLLMTCAMVAVPYILGELKKHRHD